MSPFDKFAIVVDQDGSMSQPFIQQYYEIAMDGKSPLEVSCPPKLPEPGDIAVVTSFYEAPGGRIYEIGDELHLMKRTDEAPHGKRSSLGNWVVINKYGVSVWSNIEWLLAEGRLEIEA